MAPAAFLPAWGLAYYANQVQIGGYKGYLGTSTAPSTGAGQPADPVGQGALRFTNWYTQAGSIISSGTPFPTGSGLQVVFKTISYHGDSGGAGGDGADGMGFFLMDGAYAPYDTGAFGGSLGYTCSNVNNDANHRADGTPRQYDGLAHAYLGLGIDEYGNFLNHGDNTASGSGYLPGRIGLRGAGSIAWASVAHQLSREVSLDAHARAASERRAEHLQNRIPLELFQSSVAGSNHDGGRRLCAGRRSGHSCRAFCRVKILPTKVRRRAVLRNPLPTP